MDDVLLWILPVRHNLYEPPGFQVWPDQERCQTRNAVATQCQVADRLTRIGGEVRRHLDSARPGRPVETLGIGIDRRIDQRVMGAEVPRFRRRATSAQIFGRCTHHPTVGHETPGDQRGICGRRHPHRHIYALIYHIDQLVRKQDIHPHIRKPRDEFRHQRHDLALAERDGRGDTQPAARSVGCIADGAFRRVDIGQGRLGSFIELAADIGQADAPCRTVQQSGAEPRFKTADLFGDRRGRDPQNPRRRRKITGIDRGNENRHLYARCRRSHVLFPEFTDNMPNKTIIIFGGINYKNATLKYTRPQAGEQL